jgi:putative transcriptional regulator
MSDLTDDQRKLLAQMLKAELNCKRSIMKRNLFDELSEGFQALVSERQGKLTLKQHAAERIVAPVVNSGELLSLRQKLNVSQAVFAQYLRINKRTLEN